MIPTRTVDEEPLKRPRQPLLFGGGAALLALLFALGGALGGELGQIMGAGLNVLPFAVLAVLAYFASARPNWAWVATALWLLLLVGGTALSALSLGVAGLIEGSLDQFDPAQLSPADGLRLALIMLGILAGALVGVLMLLPPVRGLLARVLPLDPASFVHAIALAAVVAITLICFTPLLVLGVPPLLSLVEELTAAGGRDDAGQIRDLIYGLIWTIPAALLAVGYGVRRNLAATLERLGFVRPSLRQVGAGLLIALLLVGLVQLLGLGIDWLWGQFGWPVSDDEAFAELIAFAINPLGALVIGVTAGLGEELAVRGALQPRLGLLLSNSFFVSLHAFQYGWDALLIVFVVGVVCGIVRQRSNTSTAAIVHGVYNFTLIMLASLGLGG